jgi:NAD(P)-dependent dehydrogenase (short-subunit alcohol dehydrogenase family)
VGLLSDRVVLVSGGTQGVGAGIARAAVREGASVVVTGRRPEVGARLAEVADFVVFLLSDRSGVVTGSVIDWDQQVFGGTD